MFQSVVALALVAAAMAAKCDYQKFSGSSYSTTDGFFHFHTTLIAEFSITCSNNVKDMPFYAVIDEHVYPLANSEETSKYQVSWHLDNSEASARTFHVKVYDEDGIAEYLKNHATKPLFTHDHAHAGLTKKSLVSSEMVAFILAAVAFYFAYKKKSEFM